MILLFGCGIDQSIDHFSRSGVDIDFHLLALLDLLPGQLGNALTILSHEERWDDHKVYSVAEFEHLDVDRRGDDF
jgi:hypothetical protein